MEQARTYCRIYSADLSRKEIDNISLAVYKYICFMSTLADYTDYQLKEPGMITKRLDPPLYNITKGIPWLVQRWPELQEHLLTGNLYVIGEAPLEALSSREVTFEPEYSKTQQAKETEETEQLEYTLSEAEDLEAARVEAEQRKYIVQQHPTVQPLPLKKLRNKGKDSQFQDYRQRSEDGNLTAIKDRSQKQTPKQYRSQDSHSIGKSESRTERS